MKKKTSRHANVDQDKVNAHRKARRIANEAIEVEIKAHKKRYKRDSQ